MYIFHDEHIDRNHRSIDDKNANDSIHRDNRYSTVVESSRQAPMRDDDNDPLLVSAASKRPTSGGTTPTVPFTISARKRNELPPPPETADGEGKVSLSIYKSYVHSYIKQTYENAQVRTTRSILQTTLRLKMNSAIRKSNNVTFTSI